MKVPGKAWLEFQSIPQLDGKTLLTQTAYFAAHGLAGFSLLVFALSHSRIHF